MLKTFFLACKICKNELQQLYSKATILHNGPSLFRRGGLRRWMYRPRHELHVCQLTETVSVRLQTPTTQLSTIRNQRLLSNTLLYTQKLQKIYIQQPIFTSSVAATTAFARTKLISVSVISIARKIAQIAQNYCFSHVFSQFSFYSQAVNYLPPYQICFMYNCTKVGAFIHICMIIQLIERTTSLYTKHTVLIA